MLKNKKILSLIVMVVLIFSQIPTVFAAEDNNSSGRSETSDEPLVTEVESDDTGLDEIEDGTEGIEEGMQSFLMAEESTQSKTTILRNRPEPSVTDPSYDARDYGLVTPVRNQGNDGTCYIYAGIAAAETALLKDFSNDFSAETLDLSEDNALYNLYTATNDPLGGIGYDHAIGDKNSGSDSNILFSEFASYSCPVREGEESYFDTAATLKKACSVDVKTLSVSDIKGLMLEYGSLAAGAISDHDDSKWYHSLSKYNTTLVLSEHAFTIIGWDDNIPAADFTNAYDETPSIDGGWLCKNSWGADWGENGCFWLSYDDGIFKDNGGVINKIHYMSFDKADEWNVYQYDGGNHTSWVGATYAANVFQCKANEEGTEQLKRIGVFLGEGAYTISVYKYNNSSVAPWAQETLLGSCSLTVPEREDGYHTVNFETPIILSYGDKYAVCIKKTDGSSFRIGYDNYISEKNAVSVLAGEGFIKASLTEGDFEDAKNCRNLGARGANLRIKAFTLSNDDGACATKTLASVTVSGDSTFPYTGSAIKPDVVIKDTNGNTVDKRLCKVSYSGNVNAGTATITVTPKSSHVEGTVSTTFTISPKDLSSATVTLAQNSYVYDGTDKKPSVTVRLNGKGLTETMDFTVSYSGNKNAGNAKASVTGKGNYMGSAEQGFTISPVNGNFVTISYPASVEYTGSKITPPVTVTYNGKNLNSGTDYTLTYGTNTAIGSGTIRVAFKGNYEGTVTKSFTITQRDGRKCTISYNRYNEYTGGSIAPEVTVSYNGEPLTEWTDYRLDYSDNIGITDSAVITITFQNLYTGSLVKYFSITPIGSDKAYIGEIEDDTDRIYNGQAYTPEPPEASWNGPLTKGTDYDIRYEDNINAGTGYIVYTFKGLLKGERKMPFNIYPESLDNAEIAGIGKQDYTGEEITPETSVTWKNTVLEKGKDYTLSYADNIEPGTATVTVTGINNFTGTRTLEFTIAKASNGGNGGNNGGNGNNNGNGNGNGGNNDEPKPEEEKPAETEPAVQDREYNVTGNGMSATVTMAPRIPFSPNAKALAESLNAKLISGDSGISIKSVKAKKPKNGTSLVTIKLQGSSKETKKAVKDMNKALKNIPVEVEKVDLSTANVEITLSNKGDKVKKVLVNGIKLKKADYSATVTDGKAVITGKGNYTGTYSQG